VSIPVNARYTRPRYAAPGDTLHLLHRWRSQAPHDRLAHLVRDALRAFDRALQMRLAPHGVTLGHWPFLRVLWRSDGLTQRELSREAGVMEPTTVAAVKAMEQLGYVVRRQLGENRRNNHVFLTPKGRRLERVLVPLAMEVNRLAVAGAPKAAVTATRSTLLLALENLARDEAHAAGTGRRMPSTREIGARAGNGASRAPRR